MRTLAYLDCGKMHGQKGSSLEDKHENRLGIKFVCRWTGDYKLIDLLGSQAF